MRSIDTNQSIMFKNSCFIEDYQTDRTKAGFYLKQHVCLVCSAGTMSASAFLSLFIGISGRFRRLTAVATE